MNYEFLYSLKQILQKETPPIQNQFVFFFKKIFYLFIFGYAGSLLLCGFFPSSGEPGLLSSWGVRVFHCGGFSCCGAWALGCVDFRNRGSQALQHRLNSGGAQA